MQTLAPKLAVLWLLPACVAATPATQPRFPVIRGPCVLTFTTTTYETHYPPNLDIISLEIVPERIDGGGQWLRLCYRRIAGGYPGHLYDTTVRPADPGQDIAQWQRLLTDIPFEAHVGPDGAVTKTIGLERLWKHFTDADPENEIMLPDYQKRFGEKKIAFLLSLVAGKPLPSGLQVEDTWQETVSAATNLHLPLMETITYKVRSIDVSRGPGVATLDIRVHETEKLPAEQLKKAGLAVTGDLRLQVDMSGSEQREIVSGLRHYLSDEIIMRGLGEGTTRQGLKGAMAYHAKMEIQLTPGAYRGPESRQPATSPAK